MNKTLQIFRHGKSSWKYNLPDHDRPLKKRGFTDIELVSKHIKEDYKKPDLILSSTANRACTTSKNYIKNLNLFDVKFQLKKELYDFSGEAVLNQIYNCEDSVNTLAIFGHNYALTDLCNQLGDSRIENLPTSGFVQIEFKTQCWQKVKFGKTTRIVFPKHLK